METTQKRKPLFYGAVLGAFLLLVGGLGWRAATRMMRMSSASAASAAATQSFKPGAPVKLFIEINQAEKDAASGTMLDRKDDTHYTRTGKDIEISFDHDTKVVMGKVADVRQGAVVYVSGKWSGNGAAHAEQIVILTGYVHVE